MSARDGWQGTVKIPTSPPTVSPNRQPDYVSAHVRLYWPHTARLEDVLNGIDAAWWNAIQGAKAAFDSAENRS